MAERRPSQRSLFAVPAGADAWTMRGNDCTRMCACSESPWPARLRSESRAATPARVDTPRISDPFAMPSRAYSCTRRVVSAWWSGGPSAATLSPAASGDPHGRPVSHQTCPLDAGSGTMQPIPMRHALSGPGAATAISAQAAGDCAAPTSLPVHCHGPIPAAATLSHPGIVVSISAPKSTTTAIFSSH
ncbi:uncharacterized protein CC84DRAFT_1179658 [Paraphaeosphaeria sporulosa]|uniref:Uncharacterized protein n=1 Tax=Paraphaeosphaeria sporulosa TaxID=1460663 RepID=A0A177C4F5_9PLEO|nr:uncharacterized protein CC84DRAFT_1179658 [Paraphaeosphaeria sporulosa]OAG01607.1 hypothetical protein CC84DRAFT_1179658 [Paraphaeosphaeria sporulosa]